MEANSHESLEDAILMMPVLQEDTLEKTYYMNFRLWHILFMGFASVMAVVICICCCVRFRIPRTKQEIEADYVRKRITRKFRGQLRLIQNAEMDEMDLRRALERVSAEFKPDNASLAHSEALSSCSPGNNDDSVFKKPSRTNDGAESVDDLKEKPNRGLGYKIASFVGILRARKNQQQLVSEKQTKIGV